MEYHGGAVRLTSLSISIHLKASHVRSPKTTDRTAQRRDKAQQVVRSLKVVSRP